MSEITFLLLAHKWHDKYGKTEQLAKAVIRSKKNETMCQQNQYNYDGSCGSGPNIILYYNQPSNTHTVLARLYLSREISMSVRVGRGFGTRAAVCTCECRERRKEKKRKRRMEREECGGSVSVTHREAGGPPLHPSILRGTLAGGQRLAGSRSTGLGAEGLLGELLL